jgi:K+-transporting ATPase ATPase C chain
MRFLKPALLVTIGLWLLLGLAFPLVMTGVSQVLFPHQANDSPVALGGRIVGVANIGQNFAPDRQYFWGRPSDTVNPATGRVDPYNPMGSGASNLGPTNRLLVAHIEARIRHLLRTTPGLTVHAIPLSLVESSGSGLDPDISVDAALIQIPRVARATGLSARRLQAMVAASTQGPQWGLFGDRVVDVLALNLRVYTALHAPRSGR